MKAALINSVSGYGSTGRIVYQLSRMPGVQGKIYYGRKDNLTDADVYRITEKGGTALHAAATFLLDAQGFANTKETERMVENLREFAPDLVHLHNRHGYYMNVEPLFRWLKESGTPVVWTLHDCWSFTGHCAHFDSIGCDGWKNGCTCRCGALMQYPWTFNPFMVKHNFQKKKEVFTSLPSAQMTVVTPSFWLADLARQSFLSKYEIETIHTGIAPETFKRTETDFRTREGIAKKFVIMACAGAWNREKGLDDLVRLSSHLQADEALVVVGVNEQQKRLFTGVNTICVSHTDSIQELCGIYSAADVFVNFTYQDTFPTVNLETQACGLPVITYKTGGSPEAITSRTGMVIPKGDLEAAEKAIRAVKHGEIRFSPEDCIRHAHTFSQENMLAAYKSLYSHKAGGLL